MTKNKKTRTVNRVKSATQSDQPIVSELVASRQGALSPYGEDEEFPWKKTPYIHPTTLINKASDLI